MKDSKIARFLRAAKRSLLSSDTRLRQQQRTRSGRRPWVHGKPTGRFVVRANGKKDVPVLTYRSQPGARPEFALQSAFMSVRAERRR